METFFFTPAELLYFLGSIINVGVTQIELKEKIKAL